MAKKTQDKSPADPEAAEESRSRMSFGEHLEELRKCVIRAAIGVLLTVGVVPSLHVSDF